jgi:hypothetical protein
MAISVLFSSPSNNDISIPIDTIIELIFSKPVDKFTINNGISLYSIGAQTWTGSAMSSKDALTSDVKSDAGQIDIVEFSTIVSGANVKLYPITKLKPTTQYYLQIAPGNDATRFVSAQTTDAPVYSIGVSGEVNVTSIYMGVTAKVYQLLFTSNTSFDLMIGGIYQDSYNYIHNVPLLINGNLNVSITTGFKENDTATINCYPAEGASTLTKILFTTSNYEQTAPTSIRIEDKLYNNVLNEYKITNTIPAPWSSNNAAINPVVIKFNRTIDNTQEILDKVKVHKMHLETGDLKKIIYVPEINGNVLKLYLQSVSNECEITDNAIYELDIDKRSRIDTLNYIV